MYGISFTYIYHKNQPNVGEYTSPMDDMIKLPPQNPRLKRRSLQVCWPEIPGTPSHPY